MSLRPPTRYTDIAARGMGDNALNLLEHELAAEKASSLGRSGERVAGALAALRDADPGAREAALKDAAAAVYAYFIQRELCGLRRHHDAIRDYGIPGEVLARLGAS